MIWYTLQITHMILQCHIQIATLRKKPGLVAVGLRSRPLPGEYSVSTINHLRLLRVKLTTGSGIFFPSMQDHKKKNIQNNPRPLGPYLRYRAWAATQRSEHLSDLDFAAPRFRRFQATVSDCCEVFRTLEFLSLKNFSPKNLQDKLKLDKFNFIQCFSSNPTTSTVLGMKWSRSSIQLAVSPGIRLPGQWLGEALIFYRWVLATDLHHDSLDIPGCGIMTSCTWINEMPPFIIRERFDSSAT